MSGVASGGRVSRLVGREVELARLESLVSRPDETIVLVTGEAGIGKTSLVDEFGRRVRAGGGTVVRGGADDVSTRRFGLWAQPARALGVEFPDSDPNVSPSEQEWELTDALADALEGAAPLTVVLEDLHRADESSVAVLSAVTRRLTTTRVMIIGTVREEPGRSDPALDALGHAAARIRLDGLDESEIRRLIEDATGNTPDAATVGAVVRRSGGNPLLARELAVAGPGRPVSASVVDLLVATMDRLGPEVLDTLGVFALAGSSAPLTAIAAARGVDVDATAAHLEAATAAAIVVAGDNVPRRFRHGLLADAAVHRLGASRAREIHLALADALEPMGADVLPDLARHLAAAVPLCMPARAAHAALAAAAHLERLRRPGDAGDILDAAIRAVAGHVLPPRVEVELWSALGDARWSAGDQRASRAAFDVAAERAAAQDDIELTVVTELGRHRRLMPFLPDPAGRDRLAELDRALPLDDSALRVALLGRRAIFAVQPPADRAGADALTADAVAMARRLGDPGVLLGALSDRYFLGTTTRARLDERAALATEAIDLAVRAARPNEMLIGYEWRFAAELERGRLHAATRVLDEMEARAAVSPGPAWVLSVAIRRAVVLALQGDRDGALAMTDTAIEHTTHLQDPEPMGLELSLRDPIAAIYGGHDPILHERIQQCLSMTGRVPSPFLQLRNAHGEMLIGLREHARRRALPYLDDAEIAFEGPTPLLTLAIMARIVTGLQIRHCAPALAAVLTEFSGLLATDNGHSPEFPVDYYLAGLALLTGDADAAVARAHDAIELARSLPSPPLEALALARLADAQASLGNDPAADAARASAEAIAEPMGLVLAVGSRRHEVPAQQGRAHHITLRGGNGDWWLEAPDGRGQLPNMVGIDQLRRLLVAPAVEVAASDLAGIGTDGAPPVAADLGPILDARAKREYRQRIIDLEAEIDDASEMADIERAARAGIELDALLDHLRSATGIGGRDRTIGGSAERARVNVARNIRRAIAAVDRVSPTAAAHLRVSVHTGHRCRYEPDPSSPITWNLEPGRTGASGR